MNSNSNYKSSFCPFCLFQNPFGIWGCDKKQSWSLCYKDQLWYSKFLKFTYKIWSNFEMIQMLKCTPNSNFKMEAEFENISRSKVVEFESNLKNRLSGSSINNSKIKICITAYRRCHASAAAERFAPLPRALACHHRRGIFVVCCRSQTSSSQL